MAGEPATGQTQVDSPAQNRAQRSRSWRSRRAVAGGAAILVAGAVAGVALLLRPQPAQSAPAATIRLPDSVIAVAAAFRPDGRLIVLGRDGSAAVYQPGARGPVATYQGPGRAADFAVAFSADRAAAATVNAQGETRVLDTATGRRLGSLPTGQRDGRTESVNSAGGLAVENAARAGVRLWPGPGPGTKQDEVTDPGKAPVTSLALSADGGHLAVSSAGSGIFLWDAGRPARPPVTLRVPGNPFAAPTVFSASGAVLVSGGNDGSVYVWSVPKRKLISILPEPPGRGIPFLAPSPDGTLLAAGPPAGTKGAVTVWSVATGAIRTTVSDPAGQGVSGLAFSPDGRQLAVTDANGGVYLWNI